MDDETTKLFIYLIMFWVVLTILGGLFNKELGTDIRELEIHRNPTESVSLYQKVLNYGNTLFSNIPLMPDMSTLFKILTFQYSKEIPNALSTFLLVFSIYSVWIVFNMIRG